MDVLFKRVMAVFTFLTLPLLTIQSNCGDEKDDIVFILDESGSVLKSDFNIMKNFVKDFVQGINIGPTKSQISVITYDDEVHYEIRLNQYSDKSSLGNAISNIIYDGRGTATDLALDFAKTYTFLPQNGGRTDALKIAILITDGASNNRERTKTAADQLKGSGVFIIAVGVGSGINYDELQYVATDNNVLNVSTFNSLSTITSKLHNTVCEKFTAASTTPIVPTVPPCIRKPTDIMFIIDTTTEDPTAIQASYNVIQNILSRLPTNSTYRIAGVGISFRPLLIMGFTVFTNVSDIMNQFKAVDHTRSPIFTEKALQTAQGKFQIDYSRHRYAILIYNGMSTYRKDTVTSAKVLSSLAWSGSITVMAVGNGLQVDQRELLQVASSPKYVYPPYGNDAINTIMLESSTNCNDCTESNTTDILLIVDASLSNTISEFSLLLDSVVKLVELLIEQSNDTHLGLISFSYDVKTAFNLVNVTSSGFVKEKLYQIRREKTASQPHKAFQHAREYGFINGGRPDARKMLVIFSNARWKNLSQVRLEALLLKDANVTVISIGVGLEVNLENYVGIASSPHHSYLMFDNDYSALDAIVSEAKYVVCQN